MKNKGYNSLHRATSASNNGRQMRWAQGFIQLSVSRWGLWNCQGDDRVAEAEPGWARPPS